VADQEIDRLLLEIEVEDKTQGGSKKLVDEFATAISKLQAEINKLDTSKLEAVSKALSFGGGGAKGTSGVGKQSAKLKKAKKELTELTKAYDEYVQAGVHPDSLAIIREKFGIDEAQKKVDELSAQGGVGSAIEDVEQTTKDWSEEVGEINTKMDYLQAKAELVQESLEKGVKTKRAYVNLKGQEISLDERITKEIEKQEKAQADLDKKLKDAGLKQSLGDLDTPLQALQAQLTLVNEKLKNSDLTADQYVRLRKQALSLEQRINKEIEKQLPKQDKTKKSELGALRASIKRVAIYRAIRGALKAITNAFKEGFGNLAQFSDEVNQTLSQLNSSFTTIKNSVAVAFLPLLNAITPIVQKVAQGIAEVANAISYLSALLTKSSTYLKVNTEYFKEMNKQARLLSFDTFEKLQGGNDIENMFSEESVKDAFSINEELGKSLTTLGLISGVVVTIGTSKLITWLKGGGLQKVADILGGDMFTNLSAIGGIVAGVWMAIDGIHGILDWDETTSGLQKAFDILKTILGVAAALAGTVAVIMAMTGGAAGAVKVASAISLGLAASAMFVKAAEVGTIKNHAFGGDYNSADLFYANENGQTELIASTNSGGGAVMNMQQLESAIYSGMVKAMASGENGESAIYLDGNKVGTFIAGNNGFRSEANRRNTGLNWR
jgi:hypothetical protein